MSRLEDISRNGGVKSREDAEDVVRILFRKFLNGSLSYTIQMASISYCKECSHHELNWKDINNIPIKDNTKASIKEARKKAKHARLNIIDMLVDNTVCIEKEIY